MTNWRELVKAGFNSGRLEVNRTRQHARSLESSGFEPVSDAVVHVIQDAHSLESATPRFGFVHPVGNRWESGLGGGYLLVISVEWWGRDYLMRMSGN